MHAARHPNSLALIQVPEPLATGFWPHLTPLFVDKVSAGFPSPASDCMEEGRDLNEYLVRCTRHAFAWADVGNERDSDTLLLLNWINQLSPRLIAFATLSPDAIFDAVLMQTAGIARHVAGLAGAKCLLCCLVMVPERGNPALVMARGLGYLLQICCTPS
jgi:hypothetical protein